MALKVDYVVKETGRNLIRNPWLAVATALTVFVALVLVGSSLLFRQGVRNATAQWQGGVEFIVYMSPDATQEQIDSVGRDLDENPQVESYVYLDRDAAFQEFRDLFERDSPELVEATTPDVLPTSYKVKPTDPTTEVISPLVAQFSTKPGVREVVAATDAIRTMQRITNGLSIGMLIVALALTGAALVLIANLIQTAMLSRRREIEVMKLVGATNWFIRVPFMLEGVVQGLIGAGGAIAGVYALNGVFDRYVAGAEGLELLGSFVVDAASVFSIATILLFAGVGIGAIASAVAVTIYLDV